MNYEHDYHAGNAADVFKHLVLLAILQSLQKKEKPFFFMDTHAGMSHYDLQSQHAQRTREYQAGIGRVYTIHDQQIPPLLRDYLSLIAKMNPDQTLRYYPGSSYIAATQLRAHDRMTAIELSSSVHEQLRRHFSSNGQVSVHHADGYPALKAYLPPSIGRGLVLIDPPYEAADEWETVADQLCLAQQRWSTGTYAVWYPIKQIRQIEHWYKRLSTRLSGEVLIVECCPFSTEIAQRLNGSGMLIVNPPWQIDAVLQTALQAIFPYLRQESTGKTRIQWLRKFAPCK